MAIWRLPSLFTIIAVILAAILLWTVDIRQGLLNDTILTATQIQGGKFPLTLSDPVGLTFKLETPPQRIVSVTLGTDEILADLIPFSRIAAITQIADNPTISNVAGHYPQHIPRISGEVEQIIAQQPDLVFVSTYTRAETVRLLLGSNIPVVRLNQFESLADIKHNILTVARVTDSLPQAKQLISALEQQQANIEAKVSERSRPRVLYYNLNNSSSGPDTTIDEMIHLAGGYNVIRETGIRGSRKVREELVIGLQPEVILVSGWNQADGPSPADQLSNRPAWKNVPAVINKRVYNLEGSWLFSVSQFSWQGVGKIAPLLHPDAFCDRTQPSCASGKPL